MTTEATPLGQLDCLDQNCDAVANAVVRDDEQWMEAVPHPSGFPPMVDDYRVAVRWPNDCRVGRLTALCRIVAMGLPGGYPDRNPRLTAVAWDAYLAAEVLHVEAHGKVHPVAAAEWTARPDC